MNYYALCCLAIVIVCVIGILYAFIVRKLSIVVLGTVERTIQEGTGFYPIIKINYQGEEHCIRCSVGSNSPKYEDGEKLQVYYRPGYNKNVYIVGNNMDLVAMTIILLLSAILLLLYFIKK